MGDALQSRAGAVFSARNATAGGKEVKSLDQTRLDTLARLGRELASEGRSQEAEAVREAISELAHSHGLITTGQAAERLRISIPTVKRWIERRVLAGVDTGTRWLVSEESVERVLRRRQTLADLDEEGNPSNEELDRHGKPESRRERIA